LYAETAMQRLTAHRKNHRKPGRSAATAPLPIRGRFDALPSAKLPEPRLVAVGSHLAVAALLDHASVVLPRVSTLPFDRLGFDRPWQDAMARLTGEVAVASTELAQARSQLGPIEKQRDEARDELLLWQREARAAIR